MDSAIGSCFEAQYKQLDHLIQNRPLTADEHIKNCLQCQERLSHYQMILKTLSQLPHSDLPATELPDISEYKRPFYAAFLFSIRENPLRWRRWKKLPWYMRTFIEAIVMITTTATIMIFLPKLAQFYNTNWTQSATEETSQLSFNEEQTFSEENTYPSTPEVPEESVIGEAETENNTSFSSLQNGLLWRFLFKTVSPEALRPTIVQILKNLSLPENTPGIFGHEVPGGIEFDLILPQTLVNPIKIALEKIPTETIEVVDTKKNKFFSWYKVHSKRHLPPGKAQVVIWLSQS